MSKAATIMVKLSPQLKAMIDCACREQSLSISDLVRQAIARHLGLDAELSKMPSNRKFPNIKARNAAYAADLRNARRLYRQLASTNPSAVEALLESSERQSA